jgi:hypothetical protein
MIRDFDELKKQLQELSSIINAFTSEAVQVRIVELIFKEEGGEEEQKEREADTPRQRSRRRKRRPKKKAETSSGEPSTRKRAARGGRKGAVTILDELISEGFFKENRAIKDIIEEARSQKARTFKANELSGPLTRFVRDERLSRQKNTDGQFEYFKS